MADQHGQFDLVVAFPSVRGDGNRAAIAYNTTCRLDKEYGLVRDRVAKFSGVFGIVAGYADDFASYNFV